MQIERRRLLSASAAFAALAGTASSRSLSSAVAGSSPQDSAVSRGKVGQTDHTKFAVNVEMWFRGTPFLDRIRKAAAMGFPAVEFWPWNNKDLDAIAAICDETGIEVAQFTAWGFVPGMNNPQNHDRFEASIREACAAAKKIGARKATVVAGNDQKGMTQAEMHGHVITGLKRVAPIAEDAGLMLILEPMNIRRDHKGHCLYGSPDAVRICREVDSPMVKINWDLYHMQISEGDLCGRLAEGIDQVGYIQLADHPGRNEPGTGEINYSRVLRQVIELGYTDFVGLECSPKESSELAAERVAAADRW